MALAARPPGTHALIQPAALLGNFGGALGDLRP